MREQSSANCVAQMHIERNISAVQSTCSARYRLRLACSCDYEVGPALYKAMGAARKLRQHIANAVIGGS